MSGEVALWFTADTHFSDHHTINLHRWPFGGTAEMDATLIAGWNATVGPPDEVWHLGDFARRPDDVAALLARLNGTKHLVRGITMRPGLGRRQAGRVSTTMPN